MVIFKWLGSLLLLLIGGAVGCQLAARERRRYRQLEGFASLVRQMRMRIDCFSAPIQEILACLDRGFLDDCGLSEPPANLLELLGASRLLIAREARGLLGEMARSIGGGDKEEQVRCCDYYLGALRPMLDAARRELATRERMALLLPLFCAAALILLLL